MAMVLPTVVGTQEGYTETLAEAWLIKSNALLVMIPGCVGITTTSMVAVTPEGSVPRLHPTLSVAGSKEHDPWLGVAETNSTPVGKESFTCTGPSIL